MTAIHVTMRLVALAACLVFAARTQQALAQDQAKEPARSAAPQWERQNHADIPDARIAKRLKEAFASRKTLRSIEVNVSVREGVAYLFGVVPSRAMVEEAGAVASRVPGVTSVVNYMNADNTGPLQSDEQIERNGLFNLIWTPFGDTSGAQLDVTDGVAILTGSVESWRGSQAAEDAALAAGAVSVVNHLVIEHPALPYSTPRSQAKGLVQGR